MVLCFIIITVLYLLLILTLVFGFYKVENFETEILKPEIKFSVIIPFRNEAENLPDLLASIKALNYKKACFEIIFVDDASTDNSVEIILKAIKTIPKTTETFRTDIKIIQNIRISNSPKKDAITSAIKMAKHDWVLTTDADCVLPKLWLDTFNSFIQQKQCKMVVAPVTYFKVNSFLKRFQLLDFLSLIGATIGGFGIGKPFLCNGANLAYSKALFLELNGFNGNNTIASGDDIFLLEKAIKKDKKAVRFLKCKNAIVKTKPQDTLKRLVSQRKRWAAKTSSYNLVFGKIVGLIVLFMNAFLVIGFVLLCLSLINYKLLFVVFILKNIVDFMLLFKVTRFFKQEKNLLYFIFSGVLYPFFSVYIAFVSMFFKYKWKGRTFKK